MLRQVGTILVYIVFFLGLIVYLPISVEAKCSDAMPGEPYIVSAVSGDKSVTLTWTEPQTELSYYLIQYGTSKENMEWGLPNIGGRGTTIFTVGELVNGVKHYFQIRAGNGCKPGSFSNTASATPGGFSENYVKTPKLDIYRKDVLGGTTSAIVATERPKPHKSVPEAVSTKDKYCAFTCNSWWLLVGEILILLGFFHFASTYRVIRPVYSVFIPVIIYLLFLGTHGNCTSYKFFCKYFLPLNISLYLLILIVHKFKFLDRHAQVKKHSLH